MTQYTCNIADDSVRIIDIVILLILNYGSNIIRLRVILLILNYGSNNIRLRLIILL